MAKVESIGALYYDFDFTKSSKFSEQHNGLKEKSATIKAVIETIV